MLDAEQIEGWESPASIGVTRDALTVWRDGKPVLTVPRRGLPDLLVRIAATAAVWLSSRGGWRGIAPVVESARGCEAEPLAVARARPREIQKSFVSHAIFHRE